MPDSSEPQPLSQNEIDALFNELGADGGDGAPPEPPPVAQSPEEPEESKGPLGQDAIDALLAQAGAVDPAPEPPAPEPPAEPPSGPLGQDAIDALLAQAGATDPAPEPAAPEPPAEAPSGPLGQDAIDALLADAGAGDPAPAAAAPEPPAEESSGPLGQDAIDALLSAAGEGESGIGAAPVVEEASGPLGQDAIDALLAQADAAGVTDEATQPDPDPPAVSDEALNQAQVDQLLSEVGKASGEDALSGGHQQPTGELNQDTIDGLLSQLGGDPDPEATMPADLAGEPKTGSLSVDQLDQLMAKHGGDGAETGGHSTEMINQGDIDALVAQLGDATIVGEPEAPEPVTSSSAVDQLLEQAEANLTAADAVAPTMIADPGSGTALPVGATMIPNGALMSTEELRGTRFLLVTAVVMLMSCTVILALVVSSVNGLTDELRKGRESEARPTDDYSEDIAAAEAYLGDDDAAQQVRGVTFMERLKEQYQNDPERLQDISWRLAEHYRAGNQHRRAVDEFHDINRRAAGLVDDPQFYVEYAESLRELDRLSDARTIAYRLVANEQLYMADNDPAGIPREPEILDRNLQAVRRAKLLLGELHLAMAISPDADRSGDDEG